MDTDFDDQFLDDGAQAEDDAPAQTGGFLDAMQDQFGTAPWWVVSVLVHSVLLGLLALIVIAVQQKTEDDVVISSEVPPEKKPEEKKPKVDTFKSEVTMKVEEPEVLNPVLIHDVVEVDERVEYENELDLKTAKGQEDAMTDVPLGGQGVSVAIGVGKKGAAGAWGHRTRGGRKRLGRRFGSSVPSESAVDAALRWLARHQEPDGSWLSKKHEGSMSDEVAVGLTGLSVLAFLGAGHTEKIGKFKDNVRRGVRYLIGRQDARGMIGRNSSHGHGGGYNHAIAGLALAEAHGMSRNPATRAAAQKAIDYSTEHHQREYDGWRYGPKSTPDLSVTGWFIMQLKSAKVAGLRVPGQAWQGAAQFLDKCEKKEEVDGYDGGLFSYQPNKGKTPTMSAVGCLGRLFMGHPPAELMGGANYMVEHLPSWGNKEFYYWYYGTLDMFQMGGDFWTQWNKAMRDMLVSNQRKGGDEDGSWDPDNDKHGGARAGRVFTTAVGALCLEVYYRYLPMYQ